ncbi:hypothetical protein KKC08_02020 [Patescibacteria group bacterium]|nr:hypothetical protein [Patescibacteria group bacterium]MCG2702703.1 hypothetical protein [Candidatus Parcubacteria bacterium]MBU4210772.1 hypothetical protein [Patescibacteria group bacterium]MBU4265318.1 hypothetical protein [Patescibacteria group bacterium]MBU4390003.1 hypothetical protein [Patescibacteria group bacterium]
MNQVQNLKKLEGLSYFDKGTLLQYINLSDNSLYANINRWIKSERIIQLKKGLYVTTAYFNKISNKDTYVEFIANRLKVPSYLSLEYVLSRYGILAESVFSHTCVTLKSTGNFSNKFGTFVYKNIKNDLFTGYQIIEKDQFEIKQATKAKALFDYIYYRVCRVKDIGEDLLSSYRLNFGEFTNKDIKEFSVYCQKAKIKKYEVLPNLIKKIR